MTAETQAQEDTGVGGWIRGKLHGLWDATVGRVEQGVQDMGNGLMNGLTGQIGKGIGQMLIMALEFLKNMFFGGKPGETQTAGNGGQGVQMIDNLETGIRQMFGMDPAQPAPTAQPTPSAPAPTPAH